jgi:CubicO group peptidase (beta-lactamase class C family)
MKRNIFYQVAWLLQLAFSLSLSLTAQADQLYFPPAQGEWETVEAADVGWDSASIQKALDLAGAQQSTGVVILHRGKIMAEQYWELTGAKSAKFNQRLIGKSKSGHGIEDVASAQKSVASFLVGIAQQKGLLKIDDPVSEYLHAGWSRATPEQEGAITVRHLITMTSGLGVRGRYSSRPGTKWLYNTAAYSKTMDLVASAAGMDRHELTRQWLTKPIGMSDSKWASRGVLGERAGNAFGFATTARDLARFGLLALAGGQWGDQVILSDQEYLKASTTSSQNMNPYYGYLWWVSRNAYAPERPPRPASAPADMFSAKGALNRRCFVVPSLDLVVTRLGDQPLAGRRFDEQFWKLLMEAAPR